MHNIHHNNITHTGDQHTPIIRRNNSPTLRHRLATSVIIFVAILATVDSFTLPPNHLIAGRSQRASASSTNSADSDTIMVDESMSKTYDTLATRLMERYEKDASSNKLKNNQLFICIAGGPGSGKSTLSEAVAQRINEQMHQKDESHHAVVLPMDGFHYSRSELKDMGESSDCDYTYDELLARRGSPWTFDADGCIATFVEARQNGKASLPIYSRAKSDPVQNGVQLQSTTKIVLLEGNYLLAWDDARWAPLRTEKVFDETWYISCRSLVEQRERLVKRHLETWSEEKTAMFGEGAKGAGAKADANDVMNLEWIEEMSRKYADCVIESV